MPLLYPFKNAKEKRQAKEAGTFVREARVRPKDQIAVRKVKGHGHKKPSLFAQGVEIPGNVSENAPHKDKDKDKQNGN